MSITRGKKVALTFDDGPNSPYTNQILDILKKEKIKAAFFVCGANIKRHPQLIRRMAKEGHLVGNHSFNHQYLPSILGLTYKEIVETQNLIEKLTQQTQKLFRAPWGMLNPWLRKKMTKNGFRIIPVGIFGNDWQKSTTDKKIAETVLLSIKDGGIITLHDGKETKLSANRSQTVKALPNIIRVINKKGYAFVKVTDIS